MLAHSANTDTQPLFLGRKMTSALNFPFKFEFSPLISALTSSKLRARKHWQLKHQKGDQKLFSLTLPVQGFLCPTYESYCPSGSSTPALLVSVFVHGLITAVRAPLNPSILDFPTHPWCNHPTHHHCRCSEDTVPLSELIFKFWLHTLQAGVFCRAHSPHHGWLFAHTKRLL